MRPSLFVLPNYQRRQLHAIGRMASSLYVLQAGSMQTGVGLDCSVHVRCRMTCRPWQGATGLGRARRSPSTALSARTPTSSRSLSAAAGNMVCLNCACVAHSCTSRSRLELQHGMCVLICVHRLAWRPLVAIVHTWLACLSRT